MLKTLTKTDYLLLLSLKNTNYVSWSGLDISSQVSLYRAEMLQHSYEFENFGSCREIN